MERLSGYYSNVEQKLSELASSPTMPAMGAHRKRGAPLGPGGAEIVKVVTALGARLAELKDKPLSEVKSTAQAVKDLTATAKNHADFKKLDKRVQVEVLKSLQPPLQVPSRRSVEERDTDTESSSSSRSSSSEVEAKAEPMIEKRLQFLDGFIASLLKRANNEIEGRELNPKQKQLFLASRVKFGIYTAANLKQITPEERVMLLKQWRAQVDNFIAREK